MAGRLEEDAFTIYNLHLVRHNYGYFEKKKHTLKFNNLYFSPAIIEGRLQDKSRGTITLHLIMTITVEYEGKADFFNYVPDKKVYMRTITRSGLE